MKIVGWHSSILIVALVLGVLFSALYTSAQLYVPRRPPSIIPTEPKISQLRALEIAVQALKDNWHKSEDEIRLWRSFYSFPLDEYNKHSESYTGYKWTITDIRKHPELLKLQLFFFHANGTAYRINATDGTYQVCDVGCGKPTDLMRNRLAWWIDLSPEPVVIDAETGKVITKFFHEEAYPPHLQIYNDGDNKTKARTIRELLNPPQTTTIEIVKGASEQAQRQQHFMPEYAFAEIGTSNKIIWKNEDAVAHTVTSDNGYSNPYTGKFDSGIIEEGQSYQYTFIERGSYYYHCQIHPFMKGRVATENFA